MATREWLLTVAVIVVPLIIALAVTLWSLEQTRYRRKTPRRVSEGAVSANKPGPGGTEESG